MTRSRITPSSGRVSWPTTTPSSATWKSNAASSLFNLSRNLGASFGIAAVTSLVARRTQVHHSLLAAHVDAANPRLQAMLSGLAQRFETAGADAHLAMQQAERALAVMIDRQAGAMAFLDAFRLVSLYCLAMVPLCFFIKKVTPKKGQIHLE